MSDSVAARGQEHSTSAKRLQPDAALAAIVGSEPLFKSELRAKLCDYIQKHKLQSGPKETLINADEALKAVFNGRTQVSMYLMMQLVSGHTVEAAAAAKVFIP